MDDGLIAPLIRSHSRLPTILPCHGAFVPLVGRLASLDVFRGLSVLAMILALDCGPTFPALSQSPWEGVQFGDLPAPFFLFAVGAAAALRFRLVSDGPVAVHKILIRSLKLTLLGLFLQGGFLHSAGDMSFGVSLTRIRICGVLQRIAFAYAAVAFSQALISLAHRDHPREGMKGLLASWMVNWQASVIVTVVYLSLTFIPRVPDWSFSPPPFGAQQTAVVLQVPCNTTGSFSPACNAAGYIDRLLFTQNHLLAVPPYSRLPACTGALHSSLHPSFHLSSLLAPNQTLVAPPTDDVSDGSSQGPLSSSSSSSSPHESWCSAPFEPMGVVSTLGAILTAFMGLHFGHIITNFQSHTARLIHMFLFSTLTIAGGLLLQMPLSYSPQHHLPNMHIPNWIRIAYPGMPLNPHLYSLSFMLLTAGLAAALLTSLYILVDVFEVRFYTRLFEWAGTNALFLFVATATPLLSALAAGFYWEDPGNNIVTLLHRLLLDLGHDTKTAALLTATLKLLFWFLIAGLMSWQGVHWRL